MRKEECDDCGAEVSIVRGNYRFDDVGLPVLLRRIQLVKCAECGNVDPIIPNLNDLMNTIALAVICRPRKLSGKQIRFLRKYVGKSAVEFSNLLHLDPTHLSKMENEHTPVGDQTDKFIRFLVLSLNEELREKVKQLIEMLPTIDDSNSCGTPQLQIDPETREYQYA